MTNPCPPHRRQSAATSHRAVWCAIHPPCPETGWARRLSLPNIFAAFWELRYDAFLRYAQLRLGDPLLAEAAVRASLKDLAATWPQALSCDSLAEVAWKTLRRHIAEGCGRQLAITAGTRAPMVLSLMYMALPCPEADAVALLCLLNLTADEAAELTGADPGTISSRLRAAHRRLGHDLGRRLRHAIPKSMCG
ncbi:RNA polymerase sigma factor [Streptomyces malaysiensis]|uniref:hypothetical protein n=1 Tax=Streptomyces malaysiensis TaxID=92644 RepID=UPI00142EBE06|nr:hypothetical protein [Streptomyces malaysiensis]